MPRALTTPQWTVGFGRCENTRSYTEFAQDLPLTALLISNGYG